MSSNNLDTEKVLEKVLKEKFGEEAGEIREFNFYIRHIHTVYSPKLAKMVSGKEPIAMIKILAREVGKEESTGKPKYLEIARASAICGPEDTPNKKVFHAITRARLIGTLRNPNKVEVLLHSPYKLPLHRVILPNSSKTVPWLITTERIVAKDKISGKNNYTFSLYKKLKK